MIADYDSNLYFQSETMSMYECGEADRLLAVPNFHVTPMDFSLRLRAIFTLVPTTVIHELPEGAWELGSDGERISLGLVRVRGRTFKV